jgi:hypothetical protein
MIRSPEVPGISPYYFGQLLSGLAGAAAAWFFVLWPLQSTLDRWEEVPLPFYLLVYRNLDATRLMPDLFVHWPEGLRWLAGYLPALIGAGAAAAGVYAILGIWLLRWFESDQGESLLEDREAALRHNGVSCPPLDHATPLHKCLPDRASEQFRESVLLRIIPEVLAPPSLASDIVDRPANFPDQPGSA